MCEVASNAHAYQQFVKFAKFFTTRLVQAVVQSRLGQIVVQPCSTEPDSSDWFNLRVDELGEIAAYMRANVSRYPPASSCLTLDFLLNTADGDVLPLESWCVRFDSADIDASVNIRTQLYHQLGTMLKSAIAASRVTPTYRYYARKQSPDTFIILYRICEGEPKLDLGEDRRKFRIGAVPSPFGSLHVDLAYRTRMEIDQPTRRLEDNSSACINTPPRRRRCSSSTHPTGVPFGVVPVTGGIMETISPVSDVISNFSTSPASQSEFPFTTSCSQRTHFRLGRSLSSSDDSITPQQHSENQSGDEPVFGMETSTSPHSNSSVPKRPAVAQISQMRNHSFPFAALLTATSSSILYSGQQLPHCIKPTTSGKRSIQNASTAITITRSMHQSATVPADVNLMHAAPAASEGVVKLEDSSEIQAHNDDDDVLSSDESFVKVAFANSGAVDGDLGDFVRECRLAPSQLSSFLTDNPASIPGLLAEFESNQEMFDNFVLSMQARVDDEEI